MYSNVRSSSKLIVKLIVLRHLPMRFNFVLAPIQAQYMDPEGNFCNLRNMVFRGNAGLYENMYVI